MPLVPFFPLISVFINFYLMSVLNKATWIRFAIWMAIGFVIYFGYGVRNSSENIVNKSRSINNFGKDGEDVVIKTKSMTNQSFVDDSD
jgi:solute carrier family 7 (cationic amino acid transporter), member 3